MHSKRPRLIAFFLISLPLINQQKPSENSAGTKVQRLAKFRFLKVLSYRVSVDQLPAVITESLIFGIVVLVIEVKLTCRVIDHQLPPSAEPY